MHTHQNRTLHFTPAPGRDSPALGRAARAGAAGSLAAVALVLAGCASAPQSPPPPASTGSAGGGAAQGADASLQTCPDTVGVVRLQDGNASADTSRNQAMANANPNLVAATQFLRELGSFGRKDSGPGTNTEGAALEALRLLIQQSNCLMIAERGRGEEALVDEVRRTNTGNNVRDNANMGPGQSVAADFVLRSMVLEINTPSSTGGSGGGGGGGPLGFLLSRVSVGQSETRAKVQLVLSDVRAGVQLAVAQGEGSGSNTKLAVSVLGGLPGAIAGGSVGKQQTTSTQTVLMQAFADAYNKLVPAMRNYKTQTIRGGPGTGGTLRVQGAATPVEVKP